MMGVLSSNYLLVFAVLQLAFQLVSAAERCFTSPRITCLDKPHRSGYCCGTYNYPACCYRTTFWSLWYAGERRAVLKCVAQAHTSRFKNFWFGIVVFFLILSTCIAGFKRRQNRLRLQQAASRTTVITTTTTTQQPLPVANPTNLQGNTFMKNDLPPSYEQIQQQGGIDSKSSQPLQSTGGFGYPSQNYNTMYSSANDPPVPPYPGN